MLAACLVVLRVLWRAAIGDDRGLGAPQTAVFAISLKAPQLSAAGGAKKTLPSENKKSSRPFSKKNKMSCVGHSEQSGQLAARKRRAHT